MKGQQNLKELLLERHNMKKAVPAFNYSDMWDLKAIAEISAETGQPVIVASNPLVVGMLGVKLCNSMVEALKIQTGACIYHHLDHSRNVKLCIDAIDAGYPSVMIDGSAEDLDTNICMVKEVVSYASRHDVVVEAEIGSIKGGGAEGGRDGGDFLAKVDDAVELVKRTNADTLAVGIGTAHGFYVSDPEINYIRLGEIAEVIPVPLVLHGGTGIPDADIKKAISLGITKVNVGTMIHCAYMNSLSESLKTAGKNPYTLDIMKEVLPKVKEVIENRIKIIV